MSQHRLQHTTELLHAMIKDGLHPGMQVYISLDGISVLDLAVGQAGPERAMKGHTLQCWMSCSKPVTAVALAQLHESNHLDWDDPVTRFIPEFSAHGKSGITIRHLLTHTGGIRSANTGPPTASWENRIQSICASHPEPDWMPHERAGYDRHGSWFILADIVQRLGQQPFPNYVQERIFAPIGMEHAWIGMPIASYEATKQNQSFIVTTSRGQAQTMSEEEHANLVQQCNPAAGGFGSARDLARFYETLLRGAQGQDTTLLAADSVRELVDRHRVGLHDETFGTDMTWGLGVILHPPNPPVSPYPYGFGPHASASTFGHGGNQCASSFTDPDRHLVVTWIGNGRPGEPRHQRFNWALNQAIYEDLFDVKDTSYCPPTSCPS